MSQKSCFIMGLPSAGKTTFLAALSYSLLQRDEKTKLSWTAITGDSSYLTRLSEVWLSGEPVERTNDSVQQLEFCLELKDDEGQEYQITFPDLSGEIFQKCCVNRELERTVASAIEKSDGILLFINPQTVREPELIAETPEEYRPDEPESYDLHRNGPTEVQLVELLQFVNFIRDGKQVNVTVAISAWDTVDQKVPEDYLTQRLPLLWQYLHTNPQKYSVQYFGISAQGGSYESREAVERMLNEYELNPITRILMVDNTGVISHDITYLLWKTLN